jgi:hypothetical protein
MHSLPEMRLEHFSSQTLRVKNPKKDEVLRKMPSEISQDKELLKSLSQEDAHLVGYATATEQITAEKEAISELKE